MKYDESGISFDAGSHTYTRNGVVYPSCSGVISHFKKPFEKQRIAGAVARKRSVPKETVLKEWEDNCSKACEFGTYVHEHLERYLLHGEEDPIPCDSLFNEDAEWEKCAETRLSSFKKWYANRKGRPKPEMRMWHDRYGVAGTADLPIFRNNVVDLFDFKTNKELDNTSKYNNRFLAPFDHLMETKFTGYCLQLSIYMYMLEDQFGYKPGQLGILWFNKEGEMVEMYVPYMKSEAQKMLTIYSIENGL